MIVLTNASNILSAKGKRTKKAIQEFSQKVLQKLEKDTGKEFVLNQDYGISYGEDNGEMIKKTANGWNDKVYAMMGTAIRQFDVARYVPGNACMPEEVMRSILEYDPIRPWSVKYPRLSSMGDWYEGWKKDMLKAAKALNGEVFPEAKQLYASVGEDGNVTFSFLIEKKMLDGIQNFPERYALLELELAPGEDDRAERIIVQRIVKKAK